ncbi:MAG: hypothetical protein HDR71_01035 [Lachnospiraceae bacterium]|nr:hypothetical protein [Lachnospiraceae bacterium]
MEENKLYFIKKEYFDKYDCNEISKDKETNEQGEHNRPCYYAFKDGEIYWMIPISSQVKKYEAVYNKSVKKYGECVGISFVYIKGNKNVALLQNMIPVTEKYIEKLYTYVGTKDPIEINNKKKKEINAKARKIVRFARKNVKMTFTPIMDLEKRLYKEK